MQTAVQADQVTVTGTGYFGASRRQVRQLAWQLGASYSGDLTHGTTTHLVCRDPSVSLSEKVGVADAWSIPVVEHAWLLDCVANKAVLPVDQYKVLRAPTMLQTVPPVPVTFTARTGEPNRPGNGLYELTPASSLPSADCHEIELLRAADSPTNCQLADLLLSTTVSPTAGTAVIAVMNMLYTGSVKGKHG